MRNVLHLSLMIAVITMAAAPATADLIIYGAHSDHPVIPGASLSDVRLKVELSVQAGKALMTLSNVSSGLELSAVFKEIVIDTVDDDTQQAVLWNPVVLTQTPDVSYSVGPYNGLPGYSEQIGSDGGMIELQADPPPSKKGAGPGEALVLEFDTVLADAVDAINAYLAFFAGGSDTAAYSVGFHAVSADVVDAQSLSGLIPEPGTLALLVGGGIFLLIRRRTRRR